MCYPNNEGFHEPEISLVVYIYIFLNVSTFFVYRPCGKESTEVQITQKIGKEKRKLFMKK